MARSRRRLLRRLLAGLASLLALGGAGALVWLVGWSEMLALDEVRVTGADGALGADVRAAADAPIGLPMVRIDTGAMADAVRELPDVADAEVSRSWPAAITISVRPRTPEAAVTDGSSWWQVDRDGVLFGHSADQPADVPVLEAPAGNSAADSAARAAGVAVLIGLPPELRELVTTVAAPTEASIELTLDGGATVLWGTPDQMERKSEVLLALLAQEASRYDVTAPSNPAVRP